MANKPADMNALRAQLQNARRVARGQPAAEAARFHSNEGKLAGALVPSKPAPDSVSPFDSTQYVGDARAQKPPPAAVPAKAGSTTQFGAKTSGPVEVALVSDIGSRLFAMRVTDLWGVMSANKAEIRRKFPDLDKAVVTLKLEKDRYSIVRYEPPAIKTMLDSKFNAVLSAMAGDTKSLPGTYTCKFEYTLKSAYTLDAPATGPSGLNPRATAELLGEDAAAFAANGKAPRFVDMCNYHPLPDAEGYAFVLVDRRNSEMKRRVYEVELAADDNLSYTFALCKVVDGKRSQMQTIVLDKSSKEERLGFPEDGIEISFSKFKNGSRCIRVDPFDMAREAETAAAHSWYEKAAGVVALGTAGGLYALPELAGLVHGDPFPESVTIGSYTFPARQVLAVAAGAVLVTVAAIIDFCSRKKTNKGDGK